MAEPEWALEELVDSGMLADQLDYVIGVDPHRDAHTIAVVDVRTGAVVFEAAVRADAAGYEQALRLAEQHASGRRAFAVEGTASFGAGLTRLLVERGEQVLEVGRLRRERRSGGKTDALDAVRAARSVLGQNRPAVPRSNGEREALRALMAAREGAVIARTAALCQLRALLVTTPEPLRSELRPLTRARLLARLSATRPDRRRYPELRGTITDLLIGDLFTDRVDKVWSAMESLYEPDKRAIPTWKAGLPADQIPEKANQLILPEGRRP